MNELEFTPQNTEKTLYSRRLHGTERMMAAISQHMNGHAHILIGTHVKFNLSISQEALLAASKAAWIHTRFAVPWLATRTVRAEGSNSWSLVYEAPKHSDDTRITQWANETIIWRVGLRSAAAWEDTIKQEYWRPADGRYSLEYHVARAPGGGFFFMASMGHWLTDARGFIPTMNIFFKFLEKEVNDGAQSVTKIPWGEEIPRLPPAISIALETTASLDKVLEQFNSAKPSSPDEISKYFVRPVKETENWEFLPSRQTDISLSKDETQAFHKACRRNGVKATAVLNSISFLSDIQTSLLTATGETNFKEVLNLFETSELYSIGGNVADRRSFLKKTLPSTQHVTGFGNVVCDTFMTNHSMENIRKCFHIKDGKISAVLRKNNFWKGVVEETESQLKNNIQSTPDVFYATQMLFDQAAASFNPAMFSTPGIVSSSFGRFSSLDLLESFTPATAEKHKSRALFVQDAWLALRVAEEEVTAVIVMTWEYDGRMTIHLLGSSRWQSDDTWNIFVKSYSDAITQVLECQDQDGFAKAKL